MERIERVGALGSTILHAEKTVGYHYDAPVRDVVTRLRMVPRARHGSQRLLHHELEVWPPPSAVRTYRDAFGNEVREFSHAVIEKQLQFAVRLWTEHRPTSRQNRGEQAPALPGVPDAGVSPHLSFSSLVDRCDEIECKAREFLALAPESRVRAEAILRWVYGTMRFQSGVTSIDTPASAALAGRVGVCQDYAHIMLALCRASGLPARYASGFIPGEGYMHAWVEVLVKERDDRHAHWMGFDPTHNRATDSQYLTVGVGRDYTDISPLSGSYYGSASGRLLTWSRTTPQSTRPEILSPSACGGNTATVTGRYPDGNMIVTQPGYSC